MFIKKSCVDEIAGSMERHLVDGAINKQAERQEKLVKAADYLNAAAEIFDESGLTAQAEVVTAILESLAAKKSKKDKKKVKSKPKAKKPAAKKAPTSEKMVDNLKQKGWVFDEAGAADQHCTDDNCAMCGDMSYAKDRSLWHLENPENASHTSRFEGDEDDLEDRLNLLEDNNGFRWKKHGPYKSHTDLEKRHFSHLFDTDVSDARDSEEELYSMLEDFKNKSESNDFEDEFDPENDSTNPDDYSEESVDPLVQTEYFGWAPEDMVPDQSDELLDDEDDLYEF